LNPRIRNFRHDEGKLHWSNLDRGDGFSENLLGASATFVGAVQVHIGGQGVIAAEKIVVGEDGLTTGENVQFDVPEYGKGFAEKVSLRDGGNFELSGTVTLDVVQDGKELTIQAEKLLMREKKAALEGAASLAP
jgi:hypothetical protein